MLSCNTLDQLQLCKTGPWSHKVVILSHSFTIHRAPMLHSIEVQLWQKDPFINIKMTKHIWRLPLAVVKSLQFYHTCSFRCRLSALVKDALRCDSQENKCNTEVVPSPSFSFVLDYWTKTKPCIDKETVDQAPNFFCQHIWWQKDMLMMAITVSPLYYRSPYLAPN